MQTKIDSDIWDDIGELSPEVKVAVFWLLTSRVDTLGYVEINARVFQFEAGVSLSSIEGACMALPRGFVRTEKGVWMRNYLRRQFGAGEGMERNKMLKTWHKHLAEVPAEVTALVLAEYPILAKPLARAIHPPAKGEREGEGEGERIESAERKDEPLSLDDALAYAQKWCASSPAMVAFDRDQVLLWHTDRKSKSWIASSGKVISTKAIAQSDLEFWLLNHKTGSAPSFSATSPHGQKKEERAATVTFPAKPKTEVPEEVLRWRELACVPAIFRSRAWDELPSALWAEIAAHQSS